MAFNSAIMTFLFIYSCATAIFISSIVLGRTIHKRHLRHHHHHRHHHHAKNQSAKFYSNNYDAKYCHVIGINNSTKNEPCKFGLYKFRESKAREDFIPSWCNCHPDFQCIYAKWDSFKRVNVYNCILIMMPSLKKTRIISRNFTTTTTTTTSTELRSSAEATTTIVVEVN